MSYPIVFEYQDPVEFLKSYLVAIQADDPAFTVRRWAVLLGYSSPVTLFLILDGKREIKVKDVNIISKGLGLEPIEAIYFRTLAMKKRAKSPEEVEVLAIALTSIMSKAKLTRRPQKRPTTYTADDTAEELFSHWTDAAVLSMLRLRAARLDRKVIQDHLLWESDPNQIEQSFRRISNLGLVEENESGEIRPKYDETLCANNRLDT